MYMLGENPFLSDPNINKVRKALSKLDFLVVQDIFLTETAEFADVILPASSYLEKNGTYTNTDRRVQLGRKVLDTARPGPGRLGGRAGHRQPDRPRLALRNVAGHLRGNGLGHPQLQEPDLRQPRPDRQAVPQPGPGAAATAPS